MGFFTRDIKTIEDLFVHGLRDIYYAEHQIMQSLPDMIENAHDPQLKQHDTLSLTTDFGVGLRLVTPVGPIRLDYAIGKDGGRTQFSIGQSF